MISFFKTE